MRIRSTPVAPLLGAILLSASTACTSATPGARAHDMSAAQHAASADDEARTAQLHAARFDAKASEEANRCSPNGQSDACWSSTSNPTREHLDDSRKHQAMAADHRAASQALRDAEARSCVGLPDTDRDTSPFDHREDIASVAPLTVGTTAGKSQSARNEGAIVTIRAVPGMTAQWLQRVIDCHLARNAALGHDVPEMAYCPLVPRGVMARVSGTEAGFAVAIRADDSQTAQEVLKRARALTSRP